MTLAERFQIINEDTYLLTDETMYRLRAIDAVEISEVLSNTR